MAKETKPSVRLTTAWVRRRVKDPSAKQMLCLPTEGMVPPAGGCLG